jgi:hypothetical protein
MVIRATQISSGSGSSNVVFNTAAISVSVGNLVLVGVANYRASAATPEIPVLTGGGLTWDMIGSSNHQADERATLFRAYTNIPVVASALTITYTGSNQDSVGWHIASFSEVFNDGSNGASAIIQYSTTGGEAISSPQTVHLSPFASPFNGTYGFAFQRGAAGLTAGSGFTQLANSSATGTLLSQFTAINDTSVDWTFPSPTDFESIAIELKGQQRGGAAFAFL